MKKTSNKKMQENSINKELLEFIEKSHSPFHAVKNLTTMLEGFEELKEEDEWKLEKGKSYYVKRKDSSMIAFRIPQTGYSSVRMASAHSDSPSFKIKATPEIKVEDKYLKLNTEVYGSAIMYSWFDRPLSLAGRVVIKVGDNFESCLVDIEQDLLMIPSVAIHMARDINDGYKFNPKIDTLPLMGMTSESGNFLKLIAENASNSDIYKANSNNEVAISEKDILGYDLYLYPRTKGVVWGQNSEFLSAHALDDLQCAFSLVKGLVESESSDSLSIVNVFDNEEVGSLTGQGADSTFLEDTISRINTNLGYDEEHLKKAISKGYCVSADNAHAVHPNHTELADTTNRPFLNGGIVIKYNASQKYTTDAYSEAMFKDVCNQAKVPFQTYANRSDIPGGSTLGNLSMRHISIKTVDIGLPQLAMHSAYETAGAKDTEYLVKAMKVFFGA